MPDIILIKEISNHVGTLTFNRPRQGNALSIELLADLHLTLKLWAEADAVRAVVITGNSDKAFSSGFDIASIPTEMTPETAEFLKTSNPLELALNSVKEFPYPVIAMINGYCFGAGLNLAMCCDIRIGADHIKAGMPPVKLGLVYHPQGLSQFIEVIGMAKTREIFLTGHTYAGKEVLEMGLVDHLVPAEALSERVYAMAAEIAKNAPLSLKGTKKILNMIGRYSLIGPEYAQTADNLIAEAFNSDDLKEGQTAFLQKRTPVFKGK
ncbi:MAG: enoyl-CoA hydratase-related protein [Desulfobacterales bacterium]|jgi:enoyl-CoA hydratase/carnithine racemase|nr:enoyl-CoA hydratase-related protein [Desulfobacterales bacterium]